MLVFVDDAGDAGFKLGKGSSRHFVIACVIFDSNLDAEETSRRIKLLRQSLGWRPEREFKFNKANKQIRLQFLNEMKLCSFRIRAVISDKSIIRSSELRNNEHSFYNFMIKEVLSHCNGRISDASVRFDGHGDRVYKKSAAAYFRKQVNRETKIIREIKFVNSKSDNLIQLADMMAGSILRTKQISKTDHLEYFAAIRGRVEDLWEFR